VLVSAAASKAERFTDNVETAFFRNDNGTILPEITEIKDYEGTRTRRSLTGRFDVVIDSNHLLYAGEWRQRLHPWPGTGLAADLEVPAIARRRSGRVHQLHLRQVQRRPAVRHRQDRATWHFTAQLQCGLAYEKCGFNTRLAYNYRSKFIQEFDVADHDFNVFWDDRKASTSPPVIA